MIDITLDNIIFSLQRSGGVSLVWQQHICRLIEDPIFRSIFYEYDNAHLNIFRNEVNIPSKDIITKSSGALRLKRYFNIRSNRSFPYIFHSSYYRFNKDKKAINVTTVHDFVYEYFVRGFRQKIHSQQKHAAILNSTANICISQSTKNDLLKYVKGVNADSLYVVYNGVDERFHPIENLQIDNIPYSKHEYVLYVGDRKTTYKNFNSAVTACSLTGRPLVMVGGGYLSQGEVEFLNTKLGANHYFHTGSVTTEMLNELYNNAFCLLYPSLYEGFGIPVIEAQKAGCPVIAHNGSSITEIIGNTPLCLERVSGVDLKEAMDMLDNSFELRQRVVNDGLENSKRFSWQQTYDQTTEIYKNIATYA